MNKKIVVLGIISLFIILGLATFTTTGKNTSISNQLSENDNTVTEDIDSKTETKDSIWGFYINFIRGDIKGYSIDEIGCWTFDCIDVSYNSLLVAIIPPVVRRWSGHIQNEPITFRQSAGAKFYGTLPEGEGRVFGILYVRNPLID